jgi:hypothetical protein
VHLGQQNIFQILRWRDVEVSERDVAASRRNKAQISRYGSRAVPLGEAAYSALYERRWREAKRSEAQMRLQRPVSRVPMTSEGFQEFGLVRTDGSHVNVVLWYHKMSLLLRMHNRLTHEV